MPAGGWTTAEVPVTVTSASGEEPTTSKGVSRPAKRSRYMYGEGLVARSTRYRSSASTSVASSKRWDSTVWNTSPARTCSRTRSTPSSKTPGAMLLTTGGASAVETVATPGGTALVRSAAIASSRVTASS